MRRFVKWLGRTLLGIVGVLVVGLLVIFGVRGMDYHRLTHLRELPPDFYVRVRSPRIVLEHVNVLDGTGGPERVDQSIVIDHGTITYAGPSSGRPQVTPASILDLKGYSVIPGLVGMHEHLFTTAATLPSSDTLLTQQSTVSRLLYLASGVTTIRTAGRIAPEADLELKKQIDSGAMIGPQLFLTAPYLEGSPPVFPEMHALSNVRDASKSVKNWAARGFTSFKAYMTITPDELRAAVGAAHALGLKVTGHLCTIGLEQAADLGIDNIEHGLLTETALYSGKRPNECPEHFGRVMRELNALDIKSERVQTLIQHLVAHHVAITSTLAVIESELMTSTGASEGRRERAMTWEAWRLSQMRRRQIAQFNVGTLLQKEMQFERAFVQAGGVLLAGCDPTGDGSVLPGFGDQRELELLVQAGFTPAEAIQIATQHGADYLGIGDRTGTVQVGKHADLVVMVGDINADISRIQGSTLVFRNGVGYDSLRIIRDVHGVAGLAD